METKDNTQNEVSLPDAKSFEKKIGGKWVELITLTNPNGLTVWLTNYGARIVGALFPDKDGVLTDVISGFSNIDSYLKSSELYYGATVGRFCNRISNGKFSLGERVYTLDNNDGNNALHGGRNGFHQQVWDINKIEAQSVEFSYLSPDMDEGYPGNLKTIVSYILTDDNCIKINFHATTDKQTILNLTNHAYFNLNGEGNGNILRHRLRIKASNYLPLSETNVPVGNIAGVNNSPFDFQRGKAIIATINDHHTQLKLARGFDHDFIIDRPSLTAPCAQVIGDLTGITLEVYTDQPALHLYTGNYLSGENKMRSGTPDFRQSVFAIETQHFSDSPNHPNFPSTILQPGKIFSSTTVYKFLS